MRKTTLRSIALIFFVAGFLILINSSSNLTGFAIVENFDGKIGFYAVIYLFVSTAIILAIAETNGTTQIANRLGVPLSVIVTHSFKKTIRGHEDEAWQAVEKIETPLGRPEKLNSGGYSVRSSKGGRVVFDKRDNGVIELEYFTKDHHYK